MKLGLSLLSIGGSPILNLAVTRGWFSSPSSQTGHCPPPRGRGFADTVVSFPVYSPYFLPAHGGTCELSRGSGTTLSLHSRPPQQKGFFRENARLHICVDRVKDPRRLYS
ncbi:hypothetical protein LX36DRAFT_313736 [Colletotrichum falcatum]|nr:hypothetical protein LX36DRAFT_313736 [Colletotrichum falcatum]